MRRIYSQDARGRPRSTVRSWWSSGSFLSFVPSMSELACTQVRYALRHDPHCCKLILLSTRTLTLRGERTLHCCHVQVIRSGLAPSLPKSSAVANRQPIDPNPTVYIIFFIIISVRKSRQRHYYYYWLGRRRGEGVEILNIFGCTGNDHHALYLPIII